MKFHLFPGILTLALSTALPLTLRAQEPPVVADPSIEESHEEGPTFQAFVESLSWQTEGKAPIGALAEIDIPEGYRYTGNEGTIKLMEAYGNLTSGQELGYLTPDDMEWFALFEFEEVGYIKDDEKDKLDAGEILKQLQAGQKEANKELSRRGMSTLEVVGWKKEPFYNPETNNLEWAIRLRSSDGGEVLNYKTKILGRRGVMDVVLVCDEEHLDKILTDYQRLLTGFRYHQQDSYAAYTQGDKVAEYGLTGLIVGGGLLVAAKSGLLAKLWKPVAVGLLAVGAVIKRLIKGRTADSI